MIEKYATQKVAYYYFAGAMILFAVQVSMGALAGTVYVLPNFLAETLAFNILRMIHTNALMVWLLMAFFGCAYYLVPGGGRERAIESPLLAYIQLGLLMFGALRRRDRLRFGIHEGREFLEQPLWIKIAIVVVALIFLYNMTMTVLKGPQDRRHQRPAPRAVGHRSLLAVRVLQSREPRRSTSCTGGTSSTSGSRACGNS